ncbi:hypothetical protein DCAR_0105229 [Daucus carota subsp. sativus]|uniref:Replication factor A C-terminal domain-containing protein n=1 Tax=Daucus carota subsp. sativus TaxID=79200 RepID=A0A166JGM8_DAUCS|nr:hypothetical protein DCAR_0105229 [Daucus carota subsp. sativus]
MKILQMIRCICKANIVEVLNGNGWYYICCPNCARTVRPVEGKYSCTQCPRADIQYTQRVVVRGEDDSGTTTFTLFNKEAEQIIGVPIQTLLSEEGEKQPMKDLPTAIKNLIGRQCAFQIKVTTYNMTHGCEEYTVTRVTDCSSPSTTPNNPMEEENRKKKQKCD